MILMMMMMMIQDTPAITPAPTPTGTLTKKKTNLSSSLASDSCSKVVGTGYTPLAEAADNSRPVTPASRSSAGSESPATPRRGGAASVRPGLIDTTSLLQSSHYRYSSISGLVMNLYPVQGHHRPHWRGRQAQELRQAAPWPGLRAGNTISGVMILYPVK